MDFCSTHVFGIKKVNGANFAAGGIINHSTQHKSLRRDKNKHQVASYVMVYKAVSHVTLPHIRELSPAPTLVA
jgi:hypothetical protein